MESQSLGQKKVNSPKGKGGGRLSPLSKGGDSYTDPIPPPATPPTGPTGLHTLGTAGTGGLTTKHFTSPHTLLPPGPVVPLVYEAIGTSVA